MTTPILTSAPTQDRNLGINIVRGFLIMGVILNHLWGDIRYQDIESHVFYVRFFERAFDGEWSRLPTSLMDAFFTGGYLIPSFMMLSGVSLYLSTSKYAGVPNIRSWLYKRFRLILVPYWFGIVLLAATIVLIALAQMALHGETLWYQMQHVSLAKHDFALQGRWQVIAALFVFPRLFHTDWLLASPQMLWFVTLLLQYYLAFALLKRVMTRLGPMPFLALALGATVAAKLILVATVGLDTDAGAHVNHVLIPFRWYEFALGMVIGYVLAHRREVVASHLTTPRMFALCVVGGLALGVTGMLIDVRTTVLGAVGAPLVITGMAVVYLPLLTKQPGRMEATWPALFFAFCGPLSYAFLIANEPLRLAGSFLRVEDVPTAVWWAFLVLYIPLTAVFAKAIGALLGIGPRKAAPEAIVAVGVRESAASGSAPTGS